MSNPRPASPEPAPTLPTAPSGVAGWLEGVAAFLGYGATTLVFLRPFLTVWRDHLAPDLGDPLFNLYVLKWSMRQLRLGLPDLWNANVFHPLPDALTLSDHLLGPAALALPVTGLGGSAVAAYNVLVFLAFALGGTTTYLVARRSGLGPVAAAVGGVVFTFVPYRFEQTSHLQVLFAPWVPLALWLFDRLLAAPRPERAAAFLLVYVLHVTGGNYLAYMIHFPFAALVVNRLVAEPGWRRWTRPRALAVLVPTFTLCAALLLALFLPYLETSRRLGLERGSGEYRHFGASSVAYLTPGRQTLYFDAVAPALHSLAPRFGDLWFAEKTLFPGFVASLLALLGAAALLRRARRRTAAPTSRARRRTLLVLALLAAIVFLAADLFTLGFLELPADREVPIGAVYATAGLALVLLAAASMLLRHRWNLPLRVDLGSLPPWPRGLALATIVTVLLSFPVIFSPAAELVPGLGGMRVPSRFFVFTAFGLAWFAALGTHWLMQRSRQRAAVGALLLALALAEAAPRPLPWFEVPLEADFPSVYQWLASHGDEVDAVVEVPFLEVPEEVEYMYFSTLHWRPLVNGYSGYLPDHYLHLKEACCWPVPDEAALAELRRLGVSHLVLHPQERRRWARKRLWQWQVAVARGEVPGVAVAFEGEGGAVIYDIRPSVAPVIRR